MTREKSDERPWTDRETFSRVRSECDTMVEMAKTWDCNKNTVQRWHDEHGIPRLQATSDAGRQAIDVEITGDPFEVDGDDLAELLRDAASM